MRTRKKATAYVSKCSFYWIFFCYSSNFFFSSFYILKNFWLFLYLDWADIFKIFFINIAICIQKQLNFSSLMTKTLVFEYVYQIYSKRSEFLQETWSCPTVTNLVLIHILLLLSTCSYPDIKYLIFWQASTSFIKYTVFNILS